ncbi:MAG: glutamine--fructose-6-phosphate transaminase (isomerizing) [Clostridiales bacterium]|jgi:glucosamine--fructose-6-phosphate aminotransferase (isomerizing)|nr:glutamine--fructose-6-phosphate transaminase (isomerizing) [Clostridiales bacterium]
MCGIVGFVGTEQAAPILLKGLSRLEYRGYDSAGVAIINDSGITVSKTKGRIKNLENLLKDRPLTGSIGIGHTRWATHGEPSDVNSHPHTDITGRLAVIHNGIIENYLELKDKLTEGGCKFVSDTDTEVIANMLNFFYDGDMLRAILNVLPMLEGSYALGVICADHPDEIFCARKDNPLVVGMSGLGGFIASDIPALLEYTRDVYIPDDLEICVVSKESLIFYNQFGTRVEKRPMHIDWDVKTAEKDGFEHFMLKEIYDQPAALRDTFNPLVDQRRRFREGSVPITRDEALKIERIAILACGTAYHAGIVGKSVIERFARIPVETDIASEFRYRDPIVQKNTLFITISQSGETADTIAALREAKKRGADVLAITNVVGSAVAREATKTLYTWAGPETAVASTKAYISQIMLLYLFALDLAQKRGVMDSAQVSDILTKLSELSEKSEEALASKAEVQRYANGVFDRKSVFYIGRGLDYALALEASLKLKEISYIHSEAYAAGELKHGTIALIEDGALVIAIATQPRLIDKTTNNIKAVKARGARVLAVVNANETRLDKEVDEIIRLPECDPVVAPILAIIPLQLFAYYMALEKGCDIDKPRNLAKSVTVE